MTAEQALGRLADPQVVARVATGLSAEDQKVLADSIPTSVDGGRRDWSIADIALLDELVAILGPAPVDLTAEQPVFIEGGEVSELVTVADTLADTRTVDPDDDPQDTFAHVLVDEAQDITPMQWRMLRRRGPQASWTIVGDPAQSAYPFPEETASAVAELTGHAPSRTFRLSKNYRSPAEVFDLAAGVITTVHPDADLPEAVRSTGIRPILRTSSRASLSEDLAATVRTLAGQVEGTIGIICPPSLAQVARDLAAGPLADLSGRVIPLTAMQAKGLEYDAAVVVDPDDLVAEAPGGVRVLYVALTRPTQRLVVTDLSDPTSPAGDHAPWRAALSSHGTD